MAYINFKEERASINNQIENRKKNNLKIRQYILKNKEDIMDYTPCKEYSFKDFNETNFGKEGILDEADFRIVESKDIVCTKFTDCNFKNIRYKNCNFIGCIFENCNFKDGGVTFENCIFIKEGTEQLPSLNNKDNLGCSFYNCNMYVRFFNCDLSMSMFEYCNITNSSFEMTYINKGLLKECKIDKIVFEDCNLSGFKTLDCYIIDLDFNDQDKTKFDDKTCFGKIPEIEKTKEEYEGIYTAYEAIAFKCKENNLVDNYGEYYYLGKVCERKSLKKIIPKLGSYIYWITCGYGQRALYPVFFSLSAIVLCAILYLFLGIKIGDEIIRLSLSSIINNDFRTNLSYLNESFNLSVALFTGVGSFNSEPIPSTYIISNIEMIIGLLMMGVGVATLIKKAKNN